MINLDIDLYKGGHVILLTQTLGIRYAYGYSNGNDWMGIFNCFDVVKSKLPIWAKISKKRVEDKILDKDLLKRIYEYKPKEIRDLPDTIRNVIQVWGLKGIRDLQKGITLFRLLLVAREKKEIGNVRNPFYLNILLDSGCVEIGKNTKFLLLTNLGFLVLKAIEEFTIRWLLEDSSKKLKNLLN